MTVFWIGGAVAIVAWIAGKWAERIQRKQQEALDAEYHRTHKYFR
jgi:hypothetical protein